MFYSLEATLIFYGIYVGLVQAFIQYPEGILAIYKTDLFLYILYVYVVLLLLQLHVIFCGNLIFYHHHQLKSWMLYSTTKFKKSNTM